MKAMIEFIKRPHIKSVIILILSTVVNIIIGSMGDWDTNQNLFIPKILLLTFFIIFHVGIVIFYAKKEINDRKSNTTLQKQIKTFEDILANMVVICNDNTSKINKCIHEANEQQIINLNIWNFNDACMSICRLVYNSMTTLNNSKRYEVTYVRLIEDNTLENQVFINAYANQNSTPPSLYNKKRNIDDINENSYHDLYLFKKGSSDIDIIIGKEFIEKKFGYSSKSERNQKKYNQYIGIPVLCDNEKMVGLLEVVSLQNAIFGTTEKEVREVADKYLIPYSNIFLLLHKMEKALLVGTNQNSNR